MADAENPEATPAADDAGKENVQKEEKEQDSTEVESDANANAASTDSKESLKKGAKQTGKKGGKKAAPKEEVKEEAVEEAQPEDGPSLPDNVFPLFMTSKTQEIYNCKCDEDVTEENPFKFIPKSDIFEDMKMRAAVCDFHPFKQQIVDYPGDDILIVYDADFKHGQNFIIALTEDAREALLKVPEEAAEGEEGAEEEEEDTTVYQYVPPEAKEWVSQGSEKEINESRVQETRGKVSKEKTSRYR